MSDTAESSVVRVLVVDDSASCRALLVELINREPGLQVVGVAADGEDAVKQAHRLLPDVIAMDIHLPKLDGFAATREIMETCPTRVVMVTASLVPQEVAASFHALECGALTVMGKPCGPGHPLFAQASRELVRTLKLMAGVQVVKRWSAARSLVAAQPQPAHSHRRVRMIAIGASTGGPIVLQSILSRLRPNLAAPILIVQHISMGFTEGLAQWLAKATGYTVQVATHGELAQPAVAYIAPDARHMTIQSDGCIRLNGGPPEHGLRPSVSCLFRSVAQAYGPHSVGVLLTGMGCDGAKELKLMRQAGALTIAQDQASAAIFGMPRQAVLLNAASQVLAPDVIAETLNRSVS